MVLMTGAMRLAKLHDILARLKRGDIVQNRQLRTWLGECGYREYEDNWSSSVELRRMLTGKPSEITDYEKLLRKATLLYNRGEAASHRRQRSTRTLHKKAQASFERALVYLEEQIGENPSLQIWLDRHCDFTASGHLSLDPVGMPRAITSRSPDNQSSGVSAMVDSKRQCKIRAIKSEIERLYNPPAQSDGEAIKEKLQSLKLKMRDRFNPPQPRQ